MACFELRTSSIESDRCATNTSLPYISYLTNLPLDHLNFGQPRTNIKFFNILFNFTIQ